MAKSFVPPINSARREYPSVRRATSGSFSIGIAGRDGYVRCVYPALSPTMDEWIEVDEAVTKLIEKMPNWRRTGSLLMEESYLSLHLQATSGLISGRRATREPRVIAGSRCPSPSYTIFTIPVIACISHFHGQGCRASHTSRISYTGLHTAARTNHVVVTQHPHWIEVDPLSPLHNAVLRLCNWNDPEPPNNPHLGGIEWPLRFALAVESAAASQACYK